MSLHHGLSAHTHTHIHTHINIFIHTHIHTHKHTHTQAESAVSMATWCCPEADYACWGAIWRTQARQRYAVSVCVCVCLCLCVSVCVCVCLCVVKCMVCNVYHTPIDILSCFTTYTHTHLFVAGNILLPTQCAVRVRVLIPALARGR
jgi:hypothetical protein